jgi:hypothetical protein
MDKTVTEHFVEPIWPNVFYLEEKYTSKFRRENQLRYQWKENKIVPNFVKS